MGACFSAPSSDRDHRGSFDRWDMHKHDCYRERHGGPNFRMPDYDRGRGVIRRRGYGRECSPRTRPHYRRARHH